MFVMDLLKEGDRNRYLVMDTLKEGDRNRYVCHEIC